MSRPAQPSESFSSRLFFHISAMLVVVAWGTSFISSKVLLDNELSAVEIYLYRFMIAYVVIFAFCHKKLKANSWIDELLFAVIGLCGGSIYFIAENTALRYTPASNVSLLTTLSPLLTVLLIGVLYKAERPKWGTWVGSVIAMIGVALIVFKNGFNFHIMPLGDILAILAAFSWAIYSVVLRKVNANYTALFITRKTFFYGLLTAIPFLLFEPEMCPLNVILRKAVWTNICFLALAASLAGYYVWSLAVAKIGAIKASNYLYFQPVVTMIFSAMVFDDDPITLLGCAGCALIVGGVWVSDRLSGR